jgi:pimeloyl-ACP methyl ester carboxylesterase
MKPFAQPVVAVSGRTIDVDGVPVHFERSGAGSPVVLLHGASGNLRDWTLRAAPEIARSHDVIAFDRPGLGLSGWPATGGERASVQAALMRGALHRIGVGRVTLVGHSYGGSVALAWALDAPETLDGLMLLAAPSHVWPGGLAVTTDLLANPLSGPILARSLPPLLPDAYLRHAASAVFAPQAAPDGYVEHLQRRLLLDPGVLRRNARQLDALKPEIRSMVPRYPAMALPTEILHGTADSTVFIDIHSEVLARQLPRARLTRLDGIGHMPHHAALPEVLAALARLAPT